MMFDSRHVLGRSPHLQLGTDAVVLELCVKEARERENVHWRRQILRSM